MKITQLLVAAAIAGATINPNIVTAEDSSAELQALKNQINELDQKLKILERKGELEKEATVEASKSAPIVSLGTGGFSVRSANTNFLLKIRGYVQTDARFYPDQPEGSAPNTFLLRRVRPIIEGTVYDKFDYRLMLDFGQNSISGSTVGNQAVVQDAYVNYRLFPELQIQVGKFKEPVGLERLQSGANLLFAERAYPTQLVPNRDTGLQLQGDLFDNTLTYAAGVFNGVADGGSSDFDNTENDKDFAGRLFAHPFKNSDLTLLQGLGVGLAGTIGDQTGSLRSYVSPGQQKIFSYQSNVTANGEHWRLSPQAYWYAGPFGILAEYVTSNQELRRGTGAAATSGQVENSAWQVAASYFLTGEKNSFKPVTPLNPFALGGDGWGAWEIGARISQLNIDSGAFNGFADANTSARRATSVGVGVNWYLNKNIKLTADYEQSEFAGGNRNALLADGEKVIFSRVQFSF